MNVTEAMDLLSDSRNQIKEMNDTMHRLQEALVAIAEMDNGAVPKFSLMCDGGGAEMVVSDYIDKQALTKYVRDQLEIMARANFEKLLSFKPVPKIETPEDEVPEPKIPEELQRKKPIPEATLTGKNGKPIVNDELISKMYFKDGKSGKQIAAETGLSESAVFNHLAKLKAAKETAAKECVRQS